MSSRPTPPGRPPAAELLRSHCFNGNPTRGRFFPHLSPSVAWAELGVRLSAGQLAGVVREIVERPYGPPEWAGLMLRLTGSPALADLSRCLREIGGVAPAGIEGAEVRASMEAVSTAATAVAKFRWQTREDREELWGLDDDHPDPRYWTTIYKRRVLNSDKEAAERLLAELTGSVERLTNALAVWFPGNAEANGVNSPVIDDQLPTGINQPDECGGRLLTSWRAIISVYNERQSNAARLSHKESGHRCLRRLNEKFLGPIVFGGRGEQPHVNETAFKDWLSRIASTSPKIDTKLPKVAKGRRRLA